MKLLCRDIIASNHFQFRDFSLIFHPFFTFFVLNFHFLKSLHLCKRPLAVQIFQLVAWIIQLIFCFIIKTFSLVKKTGYSWFNFYFLFILSVFTIIQLVFSLMPLILYWKLFFMGMYLKHQQNSLIIQRIPDFVFKQKSLFTKVL